MSKTSHFPRCNGKRQRTMIRILKIVIFRPKSMSTIIGIKPYIELIHLWNWATSGLCFTFDLFCLYFLWKTCASTRTKYIHPYCMLKSAHGFGMMLLEPGWGYGLFLTARCSLWSRAAERILRLRDKRERRAPLRAKGAENSQSLEINFGKLLLVYFMRPPDVEAQGVMRPLGACGPGGNFFHCPLSAALL